MPGVLSVLLWRIYITFQGVTAIATVHLPILNKRAIDQRQGLVKLATFNLLTLQYLDSCSPLHEHGLGLVGPLWSHLSAEYPPNTPAKVERRLKGPCAISASRQPGYLWNRARWSDVGRVLFSFL